MYAYLIVVFFCFENSSTKLTSALARKTLEVPVTKKKKPDAPTKPATTAQHPKRLKPLLGEDAKKAETANAIGEPSAKMHKIEYEQIPTHKYPFNKEHVLIENLRNRVYKGTLGVIPVRHSQALEELNFMLQGRLIVRRGEEDEDQECVIAAFF